MIYPSLLQSANIINSNSWFDIQEYKNKNRYVNLSTHNYTYIKTKIIVLNLNENQKDIINKWLDNVIDIYNLTNEYIKSKLNIISSYDKSNFVSLVNFYNLRKILKEPTQNICKLNGLNKHTADYGIKYCVEMYKSAYSNLKNKNIKTFEIKNLLKTRRRKNLVIEPNSVSKNKNSIFYKSLGIIESNLKLSDIIKKNSILQYDTLRKKYIIISPEEIKNEVKLRQYNKVGIDIGVRTFLTCYSPEKTYSIGNNTNEYIDRINKRLDNIKSTHDKNKINDSKYNKLYLKYSDKLKNKISDLHNKSANFLLSKFREITIGKVSIKSMISNLTGNIKSLVKRRLVALSHYKFRMKLHQMKKKFNVEIKEVSEYLTSKTCSRCNNISKGTKSKTYNCNKCKLKIDRDINASINIYNID